MSWAFFFFFFKYRTFCIFTTFELNRRSVERLARNDLLDLYGNPDGFFHSRAHYVNIEGKRNGFDANESLQNVWQMSVWKCFKNVLAERI